MLWTVARVWVEGVSGESSVMLAGTDSISVLASGHLLESLAISCVRQSYLQPLLSSPSLTFQAVLSLGHFAKKSGHWASSYSLGWSKLNTVHRKGRFDHTSNFPAVGHVFLVGLPHFHYSQMITL